MIPTNIRLWLIGLSALALFLAGYYVSGKFEEAEQAAVLRQQIKANLERQDSMDAVARATEAELLTERQKSAILQKKWSSLRASQNRPVCMFDADSVSLLRAATTPSIDPSR